MPAERQVRAMRKKLFSSILKQEIGWFDTYKDGSLTNRLTEYVAFWSKMKLIKKSNQE